MATVKKDSAAQEPETPREQAPTKEQRQSAAETTELTERATEETSGENRQLESAVELPEKPSGDYLAPMHPALNPQSMPIDASWSANQASQEGPSADITRRAAEAGLGAPEILLLQQQEDAKLPSNPMIPEADLKRQRAAQQRVDRAREGGQSVTIHDMLAEEEASKSSTAKEEADTPSRAEKKAAEKDAEKE